MFLSDFFSKNYTKYSPCGPNPQPLHAALRDRQSLSPQLKESREIEQDCEAEDRGVGCVTAVGWNVSGIKYSETNLHELPVADVVRSISPLRPTHGHKPLRGNS